MAAPHIAFYRSRHAVRGVLAERDLSPLALAGCAIDVDVQWYSARVTVRQEYRNNGTDLVKAFAAFDVDPGWKLVHFRAEVEDHFATTKHEAVDITSDPMTTAPEFPAKMFTADIPWALHVGHSVLTTCTFLVELATVGHNGVQFTLPKHIVPHRHHATADVDDVGGWTRRFAVQSVGRLPESLLIHFHGCFASAIDGVPKVNVAGAIANRLGDPRCFDVKYEVRGSVVQPSDDIVVTANLIKDEDSVSVAVKKETAAHVADADRFGLCIGVSPQFEATANAAPNIELVFAIDSSGSMKGWAPAVSEAVQRVIGGVPESCYVNAVRFGTSQEWFSAFSAPVSEESVNGLKRFAGIAGSDMGGTRIHDALLSTYQREIVTGHARVVVLITDGTESKLSQRAVELAANNKHSARVVAVTLGTTGDIALGSMLARVSNGVHAHANTAEELFTAVPTALSQVLTPTLTEVKVDFKYDGVDEIPPLRLTVEAVPLLPSNRRAVLYALGSETLRGCTVRVSGLYGGEARDLNIHTGDLTNSDTTANPNDVTSVSLVHATAAATRIDTLVSANHKSCLSSDEGAEVRRLAAAFFVPSPLSTLAGRTEVGPTSRLVCHRYVDRRAYYALPPPPPVLAPGGHAVDPDSGEAAVAVFPPKHATIRSGATTAQFLGDLVKGIVDSVCSPEGESDLLLGQRATGMWFHGDHKAAAAVGLTVTGVWSSVPVTVYGEERPTVADVDQWITALAVAHLETNRGPRVELALAKASAKLSGQPRGKEALAAAKEVYAARRTS